MKFATFILILMLAFVMGAEAFIDVPAQAVPPDDGLDPGLLFVTLLFCAVLLVLVGIGIAVGIALLACVAVFVALGVISSSALVAIFQRRFSAGIRALHYQLSALADLPCGVEAEKLCNNVAEQFPQSQFFAGQLVFDDKNRFGRWFHNHTVFELQRRLYRSNRVMLVLSIKV